MAKKQVGILYGGRSVEHDISLRSAKNILQNIDREQFTVHLLAIDKDGCWYSGADLDQPMHSGTPLLLKLDARKPYFAAGDQQIRPDVIFPVLHGTDGEDGSVQGLLQTMNIAYVGSGVLGSAAAMDKLLTKRVLRSAGLPVAAFAACTYNQQKQLSFRQLAADLGLPFVIKPVSLGSSVGVSVIHREEEFAGAVKEAFNYDQTVLFEEHIDGREVECALLGNDKPVVSVAGEIILAKKYEFYSFTAKYEDPDSATLTIPADMPEAIHEKVKELSLQAYTLLNCQDLARVDLFVKANGEVLINEINTIPGFTNISMYPALIRHAGIGYQELISRLLEMALERHRQSSRITTDYTTHL